MVTKRTKFLIASRNPGNIISNSLQSLPSLFHLFSTNLENHRGIRERRFRVVKKDAPSASASIVDRLFISPYQSFWKKIIILSPIECRYNRFYLAILRFQCSSTTLTSNEWTRLFFVKSIAGSGHPLVFKCYVSMRPTVEIDRSLFNGINKINSA